MNPDKTGKFICQLRKEKNLSQYQLADMIPISRQGVSKWERGVTTPDPQTLLKLSEIFDVTINELLKGEKLAENNIKDLEETTLSILDESNKKTKKIRRITFIYMTIITILALMFLSYYFINSYNTVEVYKIGNTGDKFTTTDGIFFGTKEKYYLKLGRLKNKENVNINNIRLYYKNKKEEITLVEDREIDKITIMDYYGYNGKLNGKTIKDIRDYLYIEITYNETEKEIIKLRYKRDYKNNSLFFFKQKSEIKETNESDNDIQKVEEKKEESEQIVPEKKTKEEEKQEEKPKEEIKENIKEDQKEDESKTRTLQPETPSIAYEPEITKELIISKVKEKCIQDLDSYICDYSNILIFYYPETNQLTIFENDEYLLEYDISKDKYFCSLPDCKEELQSVLRITLLNES